MPKHHDPRRNDGVEGGVGGEEPDPPVEEEQPEDPRKGGGVDGGVPA